jgi:hypothetical protein
MVALAYGVVFDSINGPVDYNPFLSPDYRNQTWAEYPYGVTDTDYLISTVTRITEIEVDSELKTGNLQGIYFDDYYYRIHTKPQSIALGNLVSAKTETVKVWNSYLEPKLLNSIDGLDDGITVTSPEPEPSYFAATEERDYQFNIAKNGNAVIDIVAIFNFIDANGPTVSITGRRLVIMPFKPMNNMQERIEWLTDIIQSFDGEQRLALRMAGRQEFEYRYYLTEQDFSRIKAIAYQWGFRIFAIPVWHEETKNIGTVSLNATEILFDTSNADYRADSLIAVIGQDNDIEAVEIDQVLSDRVTLKLPFPRTMSNVTVAPMRFARSLNGIDFDRQAPNHTFASTTFTVTDNVDLSASGSFTQYKSLDVLHNCIVLITPVTERMIRAVDVFDNGSGQIDVDVQTDYINRTFTMTFVSYNKQELWQNRQFLHRMKGKRGTFWRPTFNKDMILVSTIGPSSTSITIEPIGYPLYYTNTDIMIEMKSGTRYYNEITSGETVGNTEVLQLESVFGVTIQPADVKRISFMHKVRLDSDSVDIQHLDKGVCHTAIQVREVPA